MIRLRVMDFRRCLLPVLCSLTWTAPAIAQDGNTGPHPYRPGIDIVDYAITLDLPDRGAAINGRAVLAVRRSTRVDTLVLDLVSLRVDSVLVDNRAVTFARSDSVRYSASIVAR